MKMTVGEIYQHVDGSQSYVIIDLNTQFKTEDGEWITLALYQPVGAPSVTYARTLPNFEERFKPI